jgi:NAD(P)-dependent dehydrogenase (short-subunit alcohol dehydrogenase family)
MRFGSVIDGALDALVVPGFSRIGYAIRSTGFRALSAYSLAGKTVVITGPTSGLGGALAKQLAAMNANLVLVGRSGEKLRITMGDLQKQFPSLQVVTVIADMSDLNSVRIAAEEIVAQCPHIHAIVHNAGALLKNREVTPQGLETTIACHVLGPHLMTSLLLPVLRASHGRVITVSSGGMYAAALTDLEHGESPEMSSEKYDGTRQYAIAKRLQVTLNEIWAEREPDITFAAMHPGWADTPGVQTSLPTFRLLTKPFLRSPEQGADTIAWLVADDAVVKKSGKFWCDREVRSIHKTGNTKKSDSQSAREALWEWCQKYI